MNQLWVGTNIWRGYDEIMVKLQKRVLSASASVKKGLSQTVYIEQKFGR